MGPLKFYSGLAACCILAPSAITLLDGPRARGPREINSVLQEMRARPNNATTQLWGCASLSPLLQLTREQWEKIQPSVSQDETMRLGGDQLVIEAMRRFPQDMALQKACILTLHSLAQWNRQAFKVLGEHGAIETMAAGILAFPGRLEILGDADMLASLTDFEDDEGSRQNLERMAQTGLTEAVLEGLNTYPDDTNLILRDLCFFSNACWHPDLRSQMVRFGYLEKCPGWVQQGSRSEGAIMGEVVWVNDKCFTASRAHRNRLADAGYLAQVVAALSAANLGRRVDVLTSNRTVHNAMHSIEIYARTNSTHRALLAEAGAYGEIRSALGSGLAQPGEACACLRALAPDDELPNRCAGVRVRPALLPSGP